MAERRLLNYTTTVPTSRTVAQMQEELARHGASAVVVQYADGRPTGLSFQIAGPHGLRAFTLPVDVVPVQKILDRQWSAGQVKRAHATPEHAERVAWRVAKDWLEVQLAIVQTAMVTLEQVMLPFMVVDPAGTTLYQRYVDEDLKALQAGSRDCR
ncbi:hypothetical protein K1T35_47560 (plasmid) [Pseudonocardia sp. DSM 110487]|uniref:hypothetical protein n=1 Tax=Pseudonocardia sp. DSM 110487 TaxID=2865833 RepID=UPI001C6A70C2|nr:hypothetical protein [Pseudonocardia sp. DSM 110487]QYN41008.1 hypothetical protein K1T35_47560 [Pseudonocardia sp. DSM 110487]